jgi:hypothetical protein
VSYDHDVVIDRDEVLVVGTGAGALPVMKEVKAEAKRRKIELLILPTAAEAIKEIKREPHGTNAVLDVTC